MGRRQEGSMDDATMEGLAELIGARERLKALDKRIRTLASRLRGEDEDGQLEIEG